LNNQCPNKYKKITNGEDCEFCLKGQRIKFFYYRKKLKPLKVRGRIAYVMDQCLVLSHVKRGREWINGNEQVMFYFNRIKLFEYVKLCEEGQKEYVQLCQGEIEKRLEGSAVAETTLPYRRISSAQAVKPSMAPAQVSFWHKLKNIFNK